MSQFWPNITSTQSLASSLAPILQRDETVRANFAGTTFPTTPAPVIGQSCWRSDLQALYVCTSISPTTVWTLVYDQTAADGRYARLGAASNFTVAPTINGNTVWHSGNDGIGSGLDAGLFAGLPPASFAQLSLAQTWTGDNTIQNAWDGTNASLNIRSGAAGSDAYLSLGRTANEWLFGETAADQIMRLLRWSGSAWVEQFRVEGNGRIQTPFYGYLDAAFLGKATGVWHVDSGGTSRFFFGGVGDDNTYYRTGSGHHFRNAADSPILTMDNARWVTFARGWTANEAPTITGTAPLLNMQPTTGTHWQLYNDADVIGFHQASVGWKLYVTTTGQVVTSAYGALHDYFFNDCTTVDTTTGTGTFLTLPDIYLEDNGGQIRLNRVRTRYNCNCDCNCNCASGQCVVAGTMVLMADGSEKAVELIQPGEFIRTGGALGRAAEVVGMHRVPLGNRRLFNVSGVGVSEDHPLLSFHGWVAVDPDGARNARLVKDEVAGHMAYSAYDAAYDTVLPLETGTWLLGAGGVVDAFQAAVVEVDSPDPSRSLYSPILRDAGTFVAGGMVHGALRFSHMED